MATQTISLDLDSLQRAYESQACTPLQIIDEIYARMNALPLRGVFTYEVTHAEARAAAERVMQRRVAGETLPLFGVPFAVKDNIDIEGLETTAGCPSFAYRASASAFVVKRLLDSGALLIGKTNLDQFATGLVGVRSPYGIPQNPFSREHVPGGSSSGSAVAVARGFASFALGTDTAGSGRVPAAFNQLVGLKPTRGMLSAHGVVPACRSLDCVSVFALTVDDASKVAQLMAAYDARDPYARREAERWDPRASLLPAQISVAVPRAADLVIHEEPARQRFEAVLAALAALGGSTRELDMTPFHDTTALLYHGPFVAERLEAAGTLLEREPSALLSVIHDILNGAKRHSALDMQRAQARLCQLRTRCHELLRSVDCLLVPSTSLFPRVADVLAEPLTINTELGRYTNFANLLDLCALAIPAGMRSDGLPFGVTLLAAAGRDAQLAALGRQLQRALGSALGATGFALPALRTPPLGHDPERARIAVVGAHLSGEPLNHELTELGARFVCSTRTAPQYRLFALTTTPPKPGLLRADRPGEGHAIELEVWELDHASFGHFVQRIPAPLGVGTIELEAGDRVQGFLCENIALHGAVEISQYGGWRAYRRSRP